MHGIVFSQLRKYVEAKQGSRAWSPLLKHAQLENRVYLSVSEYPDAEMEALVSAAATRSGQPASVVLEDFGVFTRSYSFCIVLFANGELSSTPFPSTTV